jgi:hypothetical protein
MIVAGALFSAAACSPGATPTFFVPPTEATSTLGSIGQPLPGSPAELPSVTAAAVAVPTLVVPTPTPPCMDGLSYVQDLTIPDGTSMAPGQIVDKQWQVQNSGTCNWDKRYRLKLIGGDAMGVQPLQPLFPARAGTEATLRIVFTAPQSSGVYESQWQAVDPAGVPFGDAFYVQISVSP